MDEFYDIAKAYFRGTISPADENRLSEWLQDDAHKRLFREWEGEWRKQAKAQALEKAEHEYTVYRQREINQLESDYDRAIRQLSLFGGSHEQ